MTKNLPYSKNTNLAINRETQIYNKQKEPGLSIKVFPFI